VGWLTDLRGMQSVFQCENEFIVRTSRVKSKKT
jgi:hypothetical protein